MPANIDRGGSGSRGWLNKTRDRNKAKQIVRDTDLIAGREKQRWLDFTEGVGAKIERWPQERQREESERDMMRRRRRDKLAEYSKREK